MLNQLDLFWNIKNKKMKPTLKNTTELGRVSINSASIIAELQKHKYINADDLFLGIFDTMETEVLFEAFCAVLGFHEIDQLSDYLRSILKKQRKVGMVDPKIFTFQISVEKKLQTLISKKNHKWDPLNLLIGCIDFLSPKLKKILKQNNIDLDLTRTTIQHLSNLPIVQSEGFLAFLEIIDTLMDELHLDYSEIQAMNIQYEQIKNIDTFLDTMESEIVEKSDSENISLETEGKTPKKKEEKKLTIEYF